MLDSSGGVRVFKIDLHTFSSEFESFWMLYSCGFESYLGKMFANYLLVHFVINNNNNNDQQNSKCRLRGDRDETINHIISECSKLAQREYMGRHDWVGKVIHWEMRKKFKFDHTKKWYIYNPAPVLENAMHKLLRDFNIQMDHLIPARRPDLKIINKKKKKENLQNSRLCCPGWPQNKTERMWKEG